MSDRVLNMADIDSAEDTEYATVQGFKEGQVFAIGSLTAGDMIEWSEASEGEAKRTAGLRLIAKSLVDGIPGTHEGATGRRLVDSTKPAINAAVASLKKRNHKVSERIVREILKLNGLNIQDPEGAAKKD